VIAAAPRADLLRALATLAERPDPAHAAVAEALGLPGRPERGEHAAVFMFGAYPYASVYLGAEGMLGGEARDRVAGFWRALGIVPPAEPDHVAALLGLYAALVEGRDREGDQRPAVAHAAAALLWEHLLPWTMPFLDKVEELGGDFYGAWARLLRAALATEAAAAGQPSALPLHLREAPGLPSAGTDGRDWLEAFLAPVRSGLVLTRWDLRRGAAALGMHARVGERRFMLRSLAEQDPAAVTGWLAGEAARAAERHRELEPSLGEIAAFWRSRAEASAAALAVAA
jgi:hypothetical protein